MRIITLDELKNKEVINIRDGARLGYVCDAEIDIECGRITALLVPGAFHMFALACREEYRIPWEDITKISEDVILICGERVTTVSRKRGKETSHR
jgi:YlmC/YmxH family sporulation protein